MGLGSASSLGNFYSGKRLVHMHMVVHHLSSIVFMLFCKDCMFHRNSGKKKSMSWIAGKYLIVKKYIKFDKIVFHLCLCCKYNRVLR